MRLKDDHLSWFMHDFLSSPEDRLALSTGVVCQLSGTWRKVDGGDGGVAVGGVREGALEVVGSWLDGFSNRSFAQKKQQKI